MEHYINKLQNLGTRLRARRELLDYTQADMAELCGISDRTYREIEAGRGSSKIETWLKLTDILGLELVLLQKPMTDETGKSIL